MSSAGGPGSGEIVTDSLAGIWDLATGPDATLWRSQFTAIDELDPSNGASLRTLAITTGFHPFGDLVFTSTTGSFEPGGVDRVTLVTTTNDYSGNTSIHLITPWVSTTSAVRHSELYR